MLLASVAVTLRLDLEDLLKIKLSEQPLTKSQVLLVRRILLLVPLQALQSSRWVVKFLFQVLAPKWDSVVANQALLQQQAAWPQEQETMMSLN